MVPIGPPKEVLDYEVGEYNMSVGTSMAIEAITKEEALPASKGVTELWVNIRTVIRNTLGATLSTLRTMDRVDALTETVISDVDEIIAALDFSLPNMKLVVYSTGPKYIYKLMKRSIVRVPKTQKQTEALRLEMAIFKKLTESEHAVLQCDGKFGNAAARAYMISHLPHDLLSRYQFAELTLLESHTGTLKKLPEWSAKLLTKTNKHLANYIPFNSLSLTVLGDGNKDLAAYPRAIVKAYLELAVSNNWKVTTTRSKVKNDLSKMADRALGAELATMIT